MLGTVLGLACGGGASANSGLSESLPSFDSDNWGLLMQDPDEYKGATVDFVGEVFQMERPGRPAGPRPSPSPAASARPPYSVASSSR